MDQRTEEQLSELRSLRNQHQQAADAVRDQIYAVIRKLPFATDKAAVERASGVSRPTIYRLLGERSTP